MDNYLQQQQKDEQMLFWSTYNYTLYRNLYLLLPNVWPAWQKKSALLI